MTQCNGLFELMLAMHVRLDKLEQRLLGDVGKESFPSTIPLWCLQLHRELCLLCTHVQNISISKIRRFFSYSGNRRRISIGKGTLSLFPPEWGDERPSKHVKTPMRFGGFVLQASFLLFRLGFLGLSWDVRIYVRKGKGNEKRKRKSKKGRGKEEEGKRKGRVKEEER